MAKKSPIDKMNESIMGILNEYADEIQGHVNEIAVEMGKKGVKALKRESKDKFTQKTGDYAKGWKSQAEKGRLGTVVTIYNDHPALPHLLEHGHVTRNGTGRTYDETPPHPHIQPVAEELVETFEREVVSKL